MSVTSEIERLQTAKETLKTKLNAKNDNEHQITDELISEYGDFVDNISTGVDINEYFNLTKRTSNNDIRSYIKQIPMIDTSEYTNMNNMFQYCSSLTTIPLIDTSNVTNMASMFNGCYKLEAIPLIDTSNVTDMASMFNGCNLTIIPQLDTSNVTRTSYMFANCSKLTTIPQLNISNADQAECMFE